MATKKKECMMCGRKEDHYGKGTLPVTRIGGVGNVCEDCKNDTEKYHGSVRNYVSDQRALMSGLTARSSKPKEPKYGKPGATTSGVCRNCNTLTSLTGECNC
jgi:hypothetical protein